MVIVVKADESKHDQQAGEVHKGDCKVSLQSFDIMPPKSLLSRIIIIIINAGQRQQQ